MTVLCQVGPDGAAGGKPERAVAFYKLKRVCVGGHDLSVLNLEQPNNPGAGAGPPGPREEEGGG